MPIPMISHAGHYYNNKAIRANEEFDVDTEEDADDLFAIGFASRKPKEADEPANATVDDNADAPAPAEASGDYATRQLQEATTTQDNTYGKKDHYHRRDQRSRK